MCVCVCVCGARVGRTILDTETVALLLVGG